MARPLRRLARTLHGWVEPGLSALLAGVSRRLKLSLVSTRTQEQDAALAWTRLLWQNQLWRSNRWYGVPLLQWPTDLPDRAVASSPAKRGRIEEGVFRLGEDPLPSPPPLRGRGSPASPDETLVS